MCPQVDGHLKLPIYNKGGVKLVIEIEMGHLDKLVIIRKLLMGYSSPV